MACRLFGAKPLTDSMLTLSQLDLYGQTSMEFEPNYKIFIHENVVCTMVAIFPGVNELK